MDKKLKVFTAFSGYDSQCLGLNRLKDYDKTFDYELVGWSEIDRGAITAHDALFPEYADRNYGDISKIDWKEVPDFDLFTYSSPCTDFSSAGKQAGGEEGSGTRSSLLWECKKTIQAKHPDYLLFENVPAILQEKFKGGFERWLKFLRQEGYNNYWDILNSADYGVPQNRERLFIVSIKKEINKVYSFPGSVGPHPHLYEILEPDEDVDPKFIRSEWRRTHYIELEKEALDKLDNPNNSAKDYSVMPMGLYCHSSDAFVAPPLYDISRTLKTESIEAGIIYKKPNEKDGDWQMRLFTQRECFRLMGLTDEEIDKFDGKVKQTHQSRCAGNSIVVNVLFHIFRRLFTDVDKPDKNGKYVLF